MYICVYLNIHMMWYDVYIHRMYNTLSISTWFAPSWSESSQPFCFSSLQDHYPAGNAKPVSGWDPVQDSEKWPREGSSWWNSISQIYIYIHTVYELYLYIYDVYYINYIYIYIYIYIIYTHLKFNISKIATIEKRCIFNSSCSVSMSNFECIFFVAQDMVPQLYGSCSKKHSKVLIK